MSYRQAKRKYEPGGMTEDELLAGVTDALTLGGWLWTHHRRSDLALTMGHTGVPDIIAVHPGRRQLLVLELKTEIGRLDPRQREWIAALLRAGVDARIVRPDDYDDLVHELLAYRDVE